MDEDAQLMLAFQRGEDGAFDALFDRWAARLIHFLGRMVKDPAVAEELVQETFLRVYRARERYSANARFSTWLYTIAANTARNELRRPYRRHVHQSVDAEPDDDRPRLELVGDSQPVDTVVDAQRRGAVVEVALDALPERQRAALWLCAVEGLSHAEAAEALETTAKSVKSLVHRARVGLADAMTEHRAAGPYEMTPAAPNKGGRS